VIGLATTNPEEAIGDKVSAVIPDFSRPEKVLELLS
jgi:beta-phosphoglucomutase